MLDEDAYIESSRLLPASGSLGGGLYFSQAKMWYLPWHILEHMETPPLFLFHALLRFGVFKRIFHAFVCLSLDLEVELDVA